MNKAWMVLVILSLTGCASLTAAKMNRLNVGMSKAEVISAMGNPTTTKADGDTEILEYKLMAGIPVTQYYLGVTGPAHLAA
jgi:hypothetical protein